MFFFNDTATTEIYTLSLHDALPIFQERPPRTRARTFGPRTGGALLRRHCANERPSLPRHAVVYRRGFRPARGRGVVRRRDRKSTRLTPVTSLSRMPSSA